DPIITQDLTCSTTGTIVCRPNPFSIGHQIFFVPKNAASLWADYSFKGIVHGLSVGGGMIYQSHLFNAITTVGTAPNLTGISRTATIPETIEFDFVAAYELSRQYRIQFNINNLTDRLNYSQSFGNRGTPAPGRTYIVSLGVNL